MCKSLNFISSNLSLIMLVILALVQWQSITNICVLGPKRYKVLCSASWNYHYCNRFIIRFIFHSDRAETSQQHVYYYAFLLSEHASVLHIIFSNGYISCSAVVASCL